MNAFLKVGGLWPLLGPLSAQEITLYLVGTQGATLRE